MNSEASKKRIAKSGKVTSGLNPYSIKRIEERPDLNNFVTGKALNIKTESKVLKPSLAEHLANPYIYIKKVLDKHRSREYTIDHPEGWNTSCNPVSHQRPRTARAHDDFPSPRDERSKSPDDDDKRSPEKNRNARQEQYQENANLRNFVQNYFDGIHENLWARQSHIEQRQTEEKEKRSSIRPSTAGSATGTGNEENLNPYDLRDKFSKFAKLKKLNFPQNDDSKSVSQGVFKEFLKYLQTGEVKKTIERRRDESPASSKKGESPTRSAGSPSGKSPTKKQEKKIEEFEEVDNGEPDEVAERFFRSFAEVRGNPALGAQQKISMKAFMFNYKKHVENKHKIRYILSEKASKQRNDDIKIYIRDYLAAFDDIRGHLQNIKEKQANVYSAIVAYDMAGRPVEGESLIEPYKRIIDDKDKLNFERKVLVRFLELRNKRNPDTLIDLYSLNQLMKQVILEEKSQDLTMLGGFIHEFKREKQLFKEDQFNLFEMVNFIHEKKYSRSQFEIISYFIEALKKAYNLSKSFPKDHYVDPRTSFPNSFLSSVFDRLCKKASKQSEIVEKLVHDLEDEFERYRQPEATNRTNTIIEHNVLADFILRRFGVIDNHLLEVFDRLEEVGNYMTQEEIDQIPMEEVRERVYFILTGEELRKNEHGNMKKLEGFTRLLKDKINPTEEREKRSAPPGSSGARPNTAGPGPANMMDSVDLRNLNPQERERLQRLLIEKERQGQGNQATPLKDNVDLRGLSGPERERVQRLLMEKERIERELMSSGVKGLGGRLSVETKGIKEEEEDRVNRLLRDREDKNHQLIVNRQREEELRQQRERDVIRGHEINDYKEKSRKEKEDWDWEAALGRKPENNDSYLKQSEIINNKDKDDDFDLINLLNDKKPEQPRRTVDDILSRHSNVNNLAPPEAMPEFPKYQKVLDSGFVSASSFKDLVKDPRRETGDSFGNTQERFRTSEKKVLFQDDFDKETRNQRDPRDYKDIARDFRDIRDVARDPRDHRDVRGETAPEFRSSFLDTLKGLKMIEESQERDRRFETPEHIKDSILKKNETLSKALEDCQDSNFLTKSTLKGRTDDAVLIPNTVNFGKDKPMMGRFSDYEMLLPSDYYAFLARKNVEMDKDPWYIRSHHIETLTEHPKSVKDNILGAEYMSYYSALPKDTALTAKEKEIVGYSDKESLIKNLEENRKRLKEELDSKQSVRTQRKGQMTASDIQNSKGFKEVSKYYDTRDTTEGPGLMVKAYEGILDELRNKERDLLNYKRESELKQLKPPPNKWWELKDKTFIDEYIKHVFMTGSEQSNVDTYLKYVEELQIRELI